MRGESKNYIVFPNLLIIFLLLLQNSIRHNLSLHSRFMRVQNDNNGKSSYWVINPDAKPGKASRRRSCSIDGQPKDKKRRSKKLHQSTDDISALSPNAMKLKHQNRSFDNLLSVGSPCSSTDSLSNLDDFSNELVYPYNSEAFARPRSTSNVSNVSSISGRMTPTQLDIDDLDTSNLVVSGGAEETANMVESMSIDGQQHRNISATINLNESLKIVNNGSNTANQEVSPVRQHSDSFGSADSGYESPAYFPSQQPQNRNTLGKHTSPVPAKPPPPYNQPFNQMNRQAQQPMFAGRMNYYSQQASQPPQQSQNRLGHVNNHLNHAPRLTHLPMQSQPSFPQHQNSLQQQFVQQNHFTPNVQQMNPGHGFENFMATTSSSIIAPNVTMDSKINMASQFQQQHQQMRKPATQNVNVFGANMMDIPDDLHQVKLCGFADQQQLASDLDAIIRNELRDSSRNLQGICGPVSNSNDSNNNSNPLNIQTSNSFPLTGQNWVR